MKKINLRGLSEVLSGKELKNVMGGSGWEGNSCCYWESEDDWACTTSPSRASEMGTVNWCCNNSEAHEKCGC